MVDLLELILIVTCLYIGIGVVAWLWSLRRFSPKVMQGHVARQSTPCSYPVALLVSFFVVVFMWPWLWSGR